jgi:putative hydrolase of the HAD superfamily
VVAFDADDTLWHNETLFALSQERFRTLLLAHADLAALDLPPEAIDARLLEVERRNLRVYGYGIKGFMLSMIETAIEVTGSRIPADGIEAILRVGRAMLEHPVELIEGAREAVETLRARDHEVWLVTKGDLFDQESKIARSGLGGLFHRIEILSEKDEASYARLLDRHGVAAEEFVMVGNSMVSDVLPVLALGARAYHVPYAVTWAHEVAEPPEAAERYRALAGLHELPAALLEG